MQEIKLKAWGEEFILNNNSGKLDRTTQEVGDKASPEALLGVYDKLAGLILDKDKKIVSNGIFLGPLFSVERGTAEVHKDT